MLDDCSRMQVGGRLYRHEGVSAYMDLFYRAFTRYGLPLEIYVDNAKFFRGEDGNLTQLGKRLKFYDISFIFANTPESKGKGEGAVPPERHEDAPAWSEKPFEGVAFSTAKTAEANGHRYVCRDALGLEIDGRLVRLPEGNAEAVVVGTDGTAYVAAGVAMLAVFAPDGRVETVRRKGPRWNYNYAYATGVALSDDGKTVYVAAGEGEGCYLAYRTETIRR